MEKIFRNSRYKSILAFFCAFGWSLAYPLIKIGYKQFNIDSFDLGGKILFAGIRFFFAGLLILVFCYFRGIKPEIKVKKNIVWLILLAVVNTTLHYMFAYIGLGYNSSARSTILDSMGGFFLIILSIIIFSDDKISAQKLIGCLLGITGIVAININPGTNFFENITFWGDGMILLNACCAGFGGIFTRIVSRKMNMIHATGQSMLIGGTLLLIIGGIVGTESNWCLNIKGILVLFVLILISAVCFGVYNELLKYHPISQIAIFNALIPVLGVIFASILLKEELKWQYFFAVAMVAFGIYMVNFKKAIK